MSEDNRPYVGSGSKKVYAETITVERARELLKKNKPGKTNRFQRSSKIKVLKAAFLERRFEVNGDTIRLARNGMLLDSQHRLEAFLLAHEEDPTITSFESFVVYGLQPKAYDTIDKGTPRNLKDTFDRHGEEHSRELSIAARHLWLRLNNSKASRGGGFDVQIAVNLLKDHPGLKESVEYVCKHNENKEEAGLLQRMISLGVLSAMHYLMCSAASKKKANEFVRLLATGDGIGGSHPVHKLRNTLLANGKGKHQLKRDAIVGLTVKAFNAFADGEELSRLQLLEDEFPRLGGLDSDDVEEEVNDTSHETNGTGKKRKKKLAIES